MRKRYWISLIVLVWYWFSLPKPIFDLPTSMVLEASNGQLLGARIATDEQWRFPMSDSLPNRFTDALIAFEDERFYYHPGIDPIGLGRAIIQNIKNKRIVSGGSTLTMQVMRMARQADSRSIFQKLIEIILATRLELSYSKADILKLYAANAPFGGNVVGLEAASWRYFGKQPQLLSWAEAATLAVLPNAPALIHPGRNRDALKAKRNRLLVKLLDNQIIDHTTYELALAEEIPQAPLPLPRLAPHLLDKAYLDYIAGKKNQVSRLKTTVDYHLQAQTLAILEKHQKQLARQEIHNIAALILEVETGKTLAYVGNILGIGAVHGDQVNIIPAPRSAGSVIKPYLYALALRDGTILPESLLPDVPSSMQGYRPENFYEQYDGMVTAKRALTRSLNIPMVHLLQKYGLEQFHFELQKMGLTTLNYSPTHYGLPIILGGAEVSLWDVTGIYASFARTLNHYHPNQSKYNTTDFHSPYYHSEFTPISSSTHLQEEAPRINAAAIWFTFQAMQQLERPNALGNWEAFRSSQSLAWKTGTSIGFRDAWAVGVNPKYAIGVWVGNADGEGRPGLIGVEAAAPVLFDILRILPKTNWFEPPYDDMIQTAVCTQSGYRALPQCPSDSIWIPKQGLNAPTCSYHQTIHLDQTKQWQVNTSCRPITEIIKTTRFVLPAAEAYYYRVKNPNYQVLPPMHPDCISTSEALPMQFIYPNHQAQIYLPIGLDGSQNASIFTLAHRIDSTKVYWHLDEEFAGTTQYFHQLELKPSPGQHSLTVVDEDGYRLAISFTILEK